MNQFFSAKRFGSLVAKHWVDHKKRYGLSVLAFAGLLASWFVLTMFIGDEQDMSEDLQTGTYYFSLFIVGCFYASLYFTDLGWRAKAINFLLVPASSFEKFLCSLLYTVVLFFWVFTAVFYAVDSLMVLLYNSISGTASKASVVNVFLPKLIKFQDGSALPFLLFFFSIQSIFLLGSVHFKKYSFIKTIISGFAVFFLIFCLAFLFHKLVDPQDDVLPSKPSMVLQWTVILVMYGIAPLFWTVAYRRFKAKQV
jgi:hypothetical protein